MKEAKTDLWVATQLTESGIRYDAQGSEVKELNEALKNASKRGTGKAGYPEYVAVVKDFVLVIEDKATNHEKLTEAGVLSEKQKDISDYAVNGAYFYAWHIARNSSFHKVFAVGVSGDEKRHRITPLYVDDREGYKRLPDLESFVSFSENNINEYYTRYVLGEKTSVEKTTEEIIADARELHEYLRTYGSLKDQDKPLVVAGILLALDDKIFKVEDLPGDTSTTDGQLIYDAISRRLKASNIGPDAKRDKLMSEFEIIRTSARLNEPDEKLGKTPLKFYAEFLKRNVFDNIKYHSSSEDFIGRFYGEFMSYSGGDGQSLGIILTPSHICDLFCELLDLQPDDIVLDPCCGTAGFLVAAMHFMLAKVGEDQKKRKDIKKLQLHGFEIQSNMFAVAATNMILRDDGNSNIKCEDFLKQNPAEVQQKGATVGMMNPPYSQGTKADPSQYELSFVEHLLDSLTKGARAAVIVPQSSMTGKTKDEQAFKASIMKHHTLEGVITCNTDTFYGVGVNPVIAAFTAHEPHQKDKLCKFIDFRNDGYEVHAHVGLVETDSAKDKRQHMLDVWNERISAPTKFCVESTVKPDDEWLHSFYYFNDEIPTDADFEKSIGDYLSFEFSMIMQNRGYLFEQEDHDDEKLQKLGDLIEISALDEKEWKKFNAFGDNGILNIHTTSSSIDGIRLIDGENKIVPYITRSALNNGIGKFVGSENYSLGRDNAGSITIGLDTQTAFYQQFDFVTGQNIQIVTGDSLNEYTAQFYRTILKNQMDAKFNWGGNGATIGRLNTLEILLPVDDTGDPDYEYMEQYVKNMMIKKYHQYLDYMDKL